MRVTFHNHGGKGSLLAAALTAAGHQLVDSDGDVALVDADIPVPPFSTICDAHERVLVYPHGGGNPFAGPEWPTHPHTVCRFVPGAGQADVLARCGYPAAVEVIGWPYSERRPFRPCAEPIDVLFAPYHPLGNGWIPAACRASNARIHDLLAELPIRLTCRYVAVSLAGDDLGEVGVTPRPGVTYQQGAADVADAVAAIEQADVVVAGEGTFPSLAIALGCPTVMTCQVAPDDDGVDALSWYDFAADVRYPIDADVAQIPASLAQIISDACQDDAAVARWRDRFVGEPFDPAGFVDTFEAMAA